MQLANDALKNGQYEKAIQLYKAQNDNKNQQPSINLLNLASAYFSAAQYQNSMKACQNYVLKCKENKNQVKVEAYTLYCKCLIKLKKLLSHQQHQFVAQGQTLFPYHKVFQQAIKTVKQLQISENVDEYLDKMFEKLLCHPKIRNYLTDESFLTKVQKIIRNPSLGSALAKTDKRLEDVTEILLMAQQDDDQLNYKDKK